jgi:hypothetical protein
MFKLTSSSNIVSDPQYSSDRFSRSRPAPTETETLSWQPLQQNLQQFSTGATVAVRL